MKIEQVVHESRSSGVAECKPFDVVANASMMQILSDKIYSDKIKAPIQELSANAIDSHEVAGKADIPFDVHLPTDDEPHFSIRDYGTGMCQEHVEELYRIYGASEKITSNKLIGCMGIGSKSPFAYCDLFNVTSYYNGKKMVYVCAKDRRGMPTLNRMCIEDTDEPNGVEITFQCKSDDRWAFNTKAEKVFRWFDVKPNCNVDLDYKQFENAALFEGDDWTIYGDDSSYCVMGNIAYKIDAHQFESDGECYSYSYSPNQNHYFNLLKHGIVMQVKIGDVDFEAGREGLSYSQHTKDAVKDKLDQVRNELTQKLMDKMQDHSCLWDARVAFSISRRGKHNILMRICELDSKAEWNGHSLKDAYKLKDVGIASGHIVDVKGQNKIGSSSSISAENWQIFVNDTPRGAFAGCQRYLFSNDGLYVYLFNLEDGKDINTLAKALDIPVDRIKLSSTLPKPDQTDSGPSNRVKTKCFVYSETGGGVSTRYYNSGYWKEDKHVFEDGGYYIQMHGYNITSDEKGMVKMSEFNKMVSQASNLGITTPVVIGVKTSHVNKYKKSKNWVNILDFVKDKLAKYIKNNHMAKLYSYNKLLDSVRHKEVFTDSNLRKCLEKSSPVRKFGNKLRAYERMTDKWNVQINNVDPLCRSLNCGLHKELTGHKMPENKSDTLIGEYPLLTCLITELDSWKPSVTTTQIADYINLVDLSKE